MDSTVNQRIFWQISILFAIGLVIPILLVDNGFPIQILSRAVGFFIGGSLVVIINLKFLFPRLYNNVNFRSYLLTGTLICLGMSGLVNAILFFFIDLSTVGSAFLELLPQNIHWIRYIRGTILLLLSLFGSTMYEIAVVANRSANETAQLKSEKLEAELNFLKSQISPHFLFNSLNNIYTLTFFDAKLAGDSVLRLSEMLRYLLYECNAERVPIARELIYLKNYIALFELKEDEKLNIQLDMSKVDEQVLIAPLLLTPFIENAFKHSQVEDVENGWITINMSADETNIQFEVSNSLPAINYEKEEGGGIGLQNIKRQLELIYPAQHDLNIEQQGDSFHVQLSIQP